MTPEPKKAPKGAPARKTPAASKKTAAARKAPAKKPAAAPARKPAPKKPTPVRKPAPKKPAAGSARKPAPSKPAGKAPARPVPERSAAEVRAAAIAAVKRRKENGTNESPAKAPKAAPPAPTPAPEPAPVPEPVAAPVADPEPPTPPAADAAEPLRTDATRAAAPGETPASSARSVEGSDAASLIQQRARAGTADPSKIKLPQFPPPASERPKALTIEEERRDAIDAAERERREALLAEVDEKERARLEQEWEDHDGLGYKPDPDDEELEIFTIKEGFGYVQIIRNNRTHNMYYHVIEPKLSRDERLLLGFIEETLVDVLDLSPDALEKEGLTDYIKGKFDEVVFDYAIRMGDEESSEEESRERLLYYVLRDFIGEGPIDVMMSDPMIEDVSCDGPHQPVFVYHRKYEALTSTVQFSGHDELDSFVIRMAQRAGKHVSIAEPILDATMRDGSRLQATLAKEVSAFGSTFTLRKFKETPFTPIDLVRFGTMSSAMLAYLWMVIEQHMSAIYAGGTASGKTTAINALMMFIPPQNKVITIEDTRELQVPEPNWIAGITRDGFGPRDEHGRQAGEIDMFQLLKNALRQRPEYIIVGEVRGKEAYSLFQAMATGHAAYGTMHADSVDAVIHRLESDPISIPRSLLEALDVVAVQSQTRIGTKRVRRTKQLTEVVGLDPNTREILTNAVFDWEPSDDTFKYSGVSYALERIAVETGKSRQAVGDELELRVQLINHLVDTDTRDYQVVAQIIRSYYKDKESVLEWMKGGQQWQ